MSDPDSDTGDTDLDRCGLGDVWEDLGNMISRGKLTTRGCVGEEDA